MTRRSSDEGDSDMTETSTKIDETGDSDSGLEEVLDELLEDYEESTDVTLPRTADEVPERHPAGTLWEQNSPYPRCTGCGGSVVRGVWVAADDPIEYAMRYSYTTQPHADSDAEYFHSECFEEACIDP